VLALFRFAEESSRASPYKKGRAGICLCASTTQIPALPFLHCSLLSWTLYHTYNSLERRILGILDYGRGFDENLLLSWYENSRPGLGRLK
jgi:hypothetical protein